jgi:hypothetical protein
MMSLKIADSSSALHTRSGKIPALMHCKVIAKGLMQVAAATFRALDEIAER